MKKIDFNMVGIIYRKEILDIIRDKRTLFSMILIPLLLFPIISMGLGAMIAKQQHSMESKVYSVGVINPASWQDVYEELKKTEELKFEDFGDDLHSAKILLEEGSLRAIVELGSDNSQQDSLLFNIYVDLSHEESNITYDKIKDLLTEVRTSITTERLRAINAPVSILTPFVWEKINIASDEEMMGMVLSLILPYMLILLSLSGGIYPAIDLTAGEKERSTLETLLVSPVQRVEIVLGKFFTVMTAALVTAIISLVSMSVVMLYGMTAMLSSANVEGLEFSVNPLHLLLALTLMIPMTAIFAAVLLSISIMAKSTREAQSYLSPLMIAAIVPAMMSMLPGSTLTSKQALIPVLNIVLAMKDILMDQVDLHYILIVLVSTTIYAIIGIFITMRVFQREQVLFKV